MAEPAPGTITIQKAEFIEDVAAFLKGRTPETAIAELEERYRTYKMAEQQLFQKKARLLSKLPEIQKTLDTVLILIEKEGSGEKLMTDFELADNVYGRAVLEDVHSVNLWLGAGVMVEYTLQVGAHDNTLCTYLRQFLACIFVIIVPGPLGADTAARSNAIAGPRSADAAAPSRATGPVHCRKCAPGCIASTLRMPFTAMHAQSLKQLLTSALKHSPPLQEARSLLETNLANCKANIATFTSNLDMLKDYNTITEVRPHASTCMHLLSALVAGLPDIAAKRCIDEGGSNGWLARSI